MKDIFKVMDELDNKYAGEEKFQCILGEDYTGVLRFGDREMHVYASTIISQQIVDGQKKHIITLIEL